MADELLENVVLSSRPCPDCSAASGLRMTFAEWASSEFGLPGSSGRVCGGNCHCCLIPVSALPDFPNLGNVKLRGDDETDIRRILDMGPNEAEMKELMEEWYGVTGGERLPKAIYSMPFEEIIPYLRKAIARWRM